MRSIQKPKEGEYAPYTIMYGTTCCPMMVRSCSTCSTSWRLSTPSFCRFQKND